MIDELLKQQPRYELIYPIPTITWWLKAQIDKLVEEEIGSGIEIEQNNFKIAIEQFTKQIEGIAWEINNIVKLYQQWVVKNLETTWFENFLVF